MFHLRFIPQMKLCKCRKNLVLKNKPMLSGVSYCYTIWSVGPNPSLSGASRAGSV